MWNSIKNRAKGRKVQRAGKETTARSYKRCGDPKKRPQCCDLILLENCMLRCRMCSMWQCRNDVNHVPAYYYQSFIDSLYNYFGSHDMQMQFVGGEPLLKPGIIDLIADASCKGFFTSMTTNGFLLNRKKAYQLIETKMSSIALSLDSLRPEVHDFLRGRKGLFKRVMKALKFLMRYRYPEQSVCIVVTIMEPNLDDLIPLADWAQSIDDIAAISFQAVVQPFYTEDNSDWYTKERFRFLWPTDSVKVNSVIDGLIERKEKKYKIGNSSNQLHLFKRYFEYPEQFVKKGGCHLGYNSLSVNSTGDIYLCFDQEPIGNIMRHGIDEVWESPHADKVRARIKGCTQNCKLMMNCFSEEGFRIE